MPLLVATKSGELFCMHMGQGDGKNTIITFSAASVLGIRRFFFGFLSDIASQNDPSNSRIKVSVGCDC